MSDILLTQDPGELDEGSVFDLHQYLRLVAEKWRLIAVVCLLTTLAGLALFFMTPEKYRATAVIQIEQRNPLGVTSDRNPWLETWATVKYYPTQYRLLRSRGLGERVVRALNLVDEPVFNPARAHQRPAEPSAAGDDLAVAQLAKRLLAGVEIDPIENTELVRITYAGHDPELTARVANQIVASYIDWEIDKWSQNVGRTSKFLEDEIESLKVELETKEQQLNEYNKNSDIVTLDPASNLTLQRLQKLNDELSTATRERVEKEARYVALRSTPRERIADEESGGLLGEMKRDLVAKQREYESKSLVYKPNHPDMVSLKTEIDERDRVLQGEIDSHFAKAEQRAQAEFRSAQRRESSLSREIEKVKAEARDLSQVSVEYNHLQMEIDASRLLQDDLLRQLSKSDLNARMSGERETNVRVIDTALPPTSPYRPSLQQNLFVGMAGGLVLGIGLILLVHFLDRTVKTAEELERLLELPVLTVIPDISESGGAYGNYGYVYGGRRKRRKKGVEDDKARQIERIPERRPRHAISEAYRSLRTALSLSSAEELGAIAVTSAEASEGKTVTAVNLGVVMAQLGRRVLLIDGDLRKPRLHKILETSNRTGLVNFLAGGMEFEDIVVETGVAGMSFVPAGPHPPNPSELLASDRMEEIVAHARTRYDFVIVDTPPVLAVTDASLLASYLDGVVLCFRANKILREDVRACRARLRLTEVKVLGAVLNRYQPQRGGGQGRRYMYYEAYAEAVDEDVSSSAA